MVDETNEPTPPDSEEQDAALPDPDLPEEGNDPKNDEPEGEE